MISNGVIMTKTAVEQTIQQLYDSVFEKQTSEDCKEAAVSSTLMSKIATHFSEDISRLAFGDSLGKLLFSISKELDFDHPEVKCGKFLELTDKDSHKILEFLELCEIVDRSSLTHIKDDIYKCFSRVVPDARPILLKLKNQQKVVRIFASENKRLAIRNEKEVKSIDFNSSVKRFMGIWDAIDDLKVYARGCSYYQDQINFVKSKIDVYKKMHMNHMVAELESSLSEFNQNVDENYYGFQRVPMMVVAVILAKMMGGNISGSNIQFPFSNKGYMNSCIYRPLACPLNDNLTKPIANLDQVKSVVAHLDNLPEANNKPIFDHFIIISPNLAQQPEGCDYMPIFALLGEKDGKCYFIYYWM